MAAASAPMTDTINGLFTDQSALRSFFLTHHHDMSIQAFECHLPHRKYTRGSLGWCKKAVAKYGVPKSTLGDRTSGKIEVDARPGKAPVIPKEVEDSMVSKAISGADQGFGLSKRTMIAHAGTLCKTMGLKNNFINVKPRKAWWAGLKATHSELTH